VAAYTPQGKEALGAIIWTGVRISTFPPGAVMRNEAIIFSYVKFRLVQRPEEFFTSF
jgi:hypothetical protein